MFLSQLPLLLLGLLTHLQALDFSRSLACLFWRIRELAMAAAMAATAQARVGRWPAVASMLLGRPQGWGHCWTAWPTPAPPVSTAQAVARAPAPRLCAQHLSSSGFVLWDLPLLASWCFSIPPNFWQGEAGRQRRAFLRRSGRSLAGHPPGLQALFACRQALPLGAGSSHLS